MYKLIFLLFWMLLMTQCYGVIYDLNETEYMQMPPLYNIDDYKNCFYFPNNVYCSISFDLVSDQPNKLLNTIQEYSRHLITHYDHTKLRYGVCVTKNCQQIRNESEVSDESLEACLNETIWKNYKLKTKIENYVCYNDLDNNIQIDSADVIVFVILLSLLVINIIGSLCDEYWNRSEDKSILTCFSLKRNWKKLVSFTQNTEQGPQQFTGINGLRCVILYGVVLVHTFWAYLVAIENARDIEHMFHSLPLYMFFNGSTALQTYMVITGFLLAYKMDLYSEKHQINWRIVSNGIIGRYLRLTPAYAVVIAMMATWLKFLGPSALWEVTAKPSLVDCRNHWWLNLVHLNNYVYNTQCMVHGWYTAVDMQLFSFGLILYVLLKKSTYRRIILIILIGLWTVLPGIMTYLKKYDGLLLIIPGEARYLFETNPTFNEMYKVGHMNVASFLIGIVFGHIIYELQQKNVNVDKFKKYHIIQWISFICLIAIILSGSIFYRNAPPVPRYLTVIYAAVVKPLFGFVMAVFIFGLIYRFNSSFNKFFESKIWIIPSKLSYSVYVIHFSYLRIYVALSTNLLYITNFNMFLMTTCITAVSLITAVPLWLFVEAPFTELTKYMTTEQNLPTQEQTQDKLKAS